MLPVWFRKLHVSKVTSSVIQNWQDELSKRDLVPTTVLQHRQSLSSFFSWCVAEGYIAQNPVFATSPPKDRRVRNDMRPLSAPEFNQLIDAASKINPIFGNLVLVLGRTGLRWGELRAMHVQDFTETPCRCSTSSETSPKDHRSKPRNQVKPGTSHCRTT